MTVTDPTRNDSSTRASEGDLHDIVVAGLRRWPSAGVAVAGVRGDSPVQYFCHGVADVASGRPVSEGTVFRIGSLTKTIAAVAVMQLCEQGLISLDAPYVGSRLFAPAEEADLAGRFGPQWDAYRHRVKVPWL